LGLAPAPDIQGDDAILAATAVATDGLAARGAVPTAAMPPGQEGRVVWIEETARAGTSHPGQRGSACVEELTRVIWACASSMYQVSSGSDVVLGNA
jgi:hypothetical protein